MQKKLALLILAVLILIAIIPTKTQPCDDVISPDRVVTDAAVHTTPALTVRYDFAGRPEWNGSIVAPSLVLPLPLVCSAAAVTRPPPA